MPYKLPQYRVDEQPLISQYPRAMLASYQHEPIHGLSSIWGTVDHTTNAEPVPFVCFKNWALKDFTDHTQGGITTEDYALASGADFEDVVSKILPCIATTPIEHAPQIIQNSANALLAVEPMSPYQRALRHEVETLFGTAKHAPVAAQVPSVCSAVLTFAYDRGR